MASPGFAIAFVVAAIAGAWMLRRMASADRLGADFLIRKDRGRITIVGRIPKGREIEIREFFSKTAGSFSVRGTWSRERYLRLDWKGDVAPGTRQKARNFLIECLR